MGDVFGFGKCRWSDRPSLITLFFKFDQGAKKILRVDEGNTLTMHVAGFLAFAQHLDAGFCET